MVKRTPPPPRRAGVPRRPKRRHSLPLVLEQLEDRTTPSTLDIVAGVLTYSAASGEANALTLSVAGGTYSLSDTGATIGLGPGATAAGWTASSANAVTGPDSPAFTAIRIELGDLDDTVNIRSITKPATALGGAGDDTVNVSSNAPSNTGNLDGIAAALTVTADAGADKLVVSDFGASAGNGNVAVGGGSVTGFAGPGDASTVNYSAVGGSFSLVRLVGSNSPSLPEQFTITDSGAPLQLDTNGGNDTVNVQALGFAATVNTGAGDDTVNVSSDAGAGPALQGSLDDINGTLALDAGLGTNTLRVSDYGTTGPANTAAVISATQVIGLAGPANGSLMTYKATGGSFAAITLDGANDPGLPDRITVRAPNGPLTLNANAGDDTINVQSLTRPATVNGGAGDDTVNVSSDAPANLGNLDGVNAVLTIDAGAGSNVLAVSDRGGGTANAGAVLTGTQLTGFAGPADGAAINYLATGGGFSSIILIGSNSPSVAEQFTVQGPNGPLTLDANGGDDTVNLQSLTAGAAIDGGAGNDTVNVTGALAPAGGLAVTATTINVNRPVVTSAGGAVTFTNSGPLTIAAGAAINADGPVTQNGPGPVSLGDDVTTTNDAISFGGDVTLTRAVTLSTQTTPGAGDITLSGTTNGTAGGAAETLTLDAGTGAAGLGGLSGSGGGPDATGLTAVTVTDAGVTNFNGPIAITGALTQTNPATGPTTFAGPVSVGSATLRGTDFDLQDGFAATGGLAVTGSGNFTKEAAGGIAAADVGITSGGSITLNAKLTASGSVQLAGSGGVNVNAVIDPSTLLTTSDDDVVINAAVGADNSITIHAGQDGTGGVTVTGSGSLQATAAGGTIRVTAGATGGNISLGGDVTAVSQVALTAAGSITGTGTVSGAALDLDAAAGINNGSGGALATAATSLAADNTTAGLVGIANTQAAATTVTSLTTAGADLTFDQAGGGGVTFQNVAASAGTVTLTAGGDLTLPAGATVQGGGPVNLAAGAAGAGSSDSLLGRITGAAVSVRGGGGNDTFTVNLAPGSAAQVSIDGQGGSDRFEVTPSAATTFTMHGNTPPPPASPGDALAIDAAGASSPAVTATPTPTGFQGSWTFGNRQPVHFDTIETLEGTTDLSVTVSGPAAASEGEAVTYTVVVTNHGPADAAGVTLADTLPAGATFLSAATSQGSFVASGGVVTFDLGALAGGASATVTVTVVPVEDGPLTNSAGVSAGGVPDAVAANDAGQATVAVAEPPLSAAGVPVSGFERTPLAGVVVATFTHANGVEAPDHFTATIDWGDGSRSAGTVVRAGGVYQVLGSHTYLDEGAFAVTVAIADDAASATAAARAVILEELLPGGVRGTADQRFISEAFRDLFDRPVDPAHLATLTAQRGRKVPWFSLVLGLIRRAPFRGLFRAELARALYEAVRGVPPTAAQLAPALRFLSAGGTFVRLTRRLGGYGKAQARQAFVSVLYLHYLDRLPDPADLASCLRLLRHGVPEDVLVARLVGGVEFYRKTIA